SREKDRTYLKRVLEGNKPGIVTVPLVRKVGDQEPPLLDQVSKGELPFYARKLPPWPEGAEAIKVRLQRPDGTYEIVKEKKDDKDLVGAWKLKLPKELDGVSADAERVDNLLVNLSQLTPADFVQVNTKDWATYGLDKPTIQVSVTLLKNDKKT